LTDRNRSTVLTLVVVTFGLGYFLSYFLRNVNAVLSPDLVAEFSLNATALGLLTSTYFIMAAIILIPVAVALDRFGPRRVLMAQLVIASMGCAVFALGASPTALLVGRALIGAGVAGCLMSAFKAVTVWFPRDRWATGNSLILGVGSIGVIASTQPLQWLMEFVSWREVFWLALGLCAITTLLALVFVPDQNARPRTGQADHVYRQIFSLPVFWRLMPVASLTMAVFFAIQGLWANAWMTDVAGLTQLEVGSRLLVMALAMSCGMLLNGTIADLLTNMGVPLAVVLAVGVACLLLAQLLLLTGVAPDALWPWALMGFTGNVGALGYPLISRRFPTSVSARAMSVLAMSNFALAFAVQFMFGWILDLWGKTGDGAYPVIAFSYGLGVFLLLQAMAFIWFLTSSEVWINPTSDEESA